MKTSMLGRAKREALAARWPEVMARGVSDGAGEALSPGDLVRLPAAVRLGDGADWDACGTVLGYALDKHGVPSVVVHAPAWVGGKADSWATWIISGESCARVGEDEVAGLVREMEARGLTGLRRELVADADARAKVSASWLQVMLSGVSTKGSVVVRPGDLVRLPRNVARNRGSQLHAAGTCLGYAVGLDGSPCVVADAVGEDVPGTVRWRTWLARGTDVIVIDSKEAWRLEAMYDRSGRLRPKTKGRR